MLKYSAPGAKSHQAGALCMACGPSPFLPRYPLLGFRVLFFLWSKRVADECVVALGPGFKRRGPGTLHATSVITHCERPIFNHNLCRHGAFKASGPAILDKVCFPRGGVRCTRKVGPIISWKRPARILTRQVKRMDANSGLNLCRTLLKRCRWNV